MAEKKFYWLKLQRDFFKRHDIRIIEEMENGKDYLLFYLKLLVESIDHEGLLRFSDTVPYNDKMLSVVTNTNVDIVRTALKVFSELNMIEILEDETIFMTEVEKMIGAANQDDHTRESTRLRVKAYRERKKLLEIEEKRYSNVTCNGEIEKEKELEIEKEKDIYTSDSAQDILDLYRLHCPSLPDVRVLNKKRKGLINGLLKTFSIDEVIEGFKKAEASDFCKGKTGWKADFEFLINQNNMAKVLEGKYDNRDHKPESIADRWANI